MVKQFEVIARSGRTLRKSVRDRAKRCFDAMGRVWASAGPAGIAIATLIILLIILLGLRSSFEEFGQISQGVYIEAWGTVFDVLIVGIIFALYAVHRDRKERIERHVEEIDDFKKWNSEEARLRIAGAVRRLNRHGIVAIDFGGIELRDFSFARHDIITIDGSTFYDGTWGTTGSRDKVFLERVDFSHINCRKVVFSKFHPLGGITRSIKFAEITDCLFIRTDLSNAIFKGAHIEWTTEHPTSLGVWHELADEPPSFEQTYYPPFYDAILDGTCFADVTFKNADFRQAEGILECDFVGATGIETCLFDNEETKTLALKMAAQKR